MKCTIFAAVIAAATAGTGQFDSTSLNQNVQHKTESTWGELSDAWTDGTPAPANQPNPTTSYTNFNTGPAQGDHDNLTPSISNAPTPVPATQYPTLAPTSSPTFGADNSCNYGGNVYHSGAHFRGAGAAYCNLCQCDNGSVTCSQRTCGATQYTNTCTHVDCSFVHSAAAGREVVQTSYRQDANKKTWNSNLGNFNNGNAHSCKHNRHTSACACTCADVATNADGFEPDSNGPLSGQ